MSPGSVLTGIAAKEPLWTSSGPVNPELVFSLRRVTEAAACAAFNWIGRGDSLDAGRAALDAMRAALADIDIDAVVAIGEATRGEAPQPQRGERLGTPGFRLQGRCRGRSGRGHELSRARPDQCAGRARRGRPRRHDEPGARLLHGEIRGKRAGARQDRSALAGGEEAHHPCRGSQQGRRPISPSSCWKSRAIASLSIASLAAGARVALYPAGDVAGALMAAIPGSGIDALMGTGGTPEGVMSACAIRGIGGEFLARLDPQLQTETKAVKEAGIDTSKWYQCDEIITSDNVFFCATGITTGLMLEGVERTKSHYKVQTMMITGATGERQILTTLHADRAHGEHRRARRRLKPDLGGRAWSAEMSKRVEHPIILGIVGDSASGKSTLSVGVAQILGEEHCTVICTDDYHRYDRKARATLGLSALDPRANHIDILEQHLRLLRRGEAVLKPVYDHRDGTFEAPEYVKPKEFVIAEGLLGYATRGMRDCYDVKIYLDPEEDLTVKWKMHRDTTKRGYTREQVLAQLERREIDSPNFIHPQRTFADIVIRFQRPAGANGSDTRLDVRHILRPTLPHPDFTPLFDGSSNAGLAPRACSRP